MSRMRMRCTLALGLLAAGISPAFSQTIMSGEKFEPTERQCLAALESGADASYAHAQRLPDQRAILKQWAEFVEEA